MPAKPDPKALSRDQLAKILPDHESIRRLERLFEVAGKETPDEVEAARIEAGIANAAANRAAGALERIADAAMLIATQPAVERVADDDIDIIHGTSGAVNQLDAIEFSRSSAYARRIGSISWSDAADTVEIEHSNGVTMQVGLEEYARTTNYGAADILNGQVVGLYLSGSVGFQRFIANGTFPPFYVVGVATEDIPIGETGRVTTRGAVNGINTTGSLYGETWAAGDVLYASPTISGGLTKVKPLPPNVAIPMAVVIVSDALNGSISVRPTILLPFYFGGFGSTATQAITAANTPQAATLNTTYQSSGVSIGTPSSRLVFANSGLYFFTTVVQFAKSSAATGQVWVWLRRNGVDETPTSSRSTLSGSGAQTVVTRTFALSISAGDYIEFMVAADNTATSLIANAATGAIPATPSITVTVSQNNQ